MTEVKLSCGSGYYTCKKDWSSTSCKIHGAGEDSIVFSKNNEGPIYKTSYFEVCLQESPFLLRGESKTVEEAEEIAWEKYQNQDDDWGHTSDSVTRCQTCNKPTLFFFGWNADRTRRDIPYCEKHLSQAPEGKYAEIVYDTEDRFSEDERTKAFNYIVNKD